MKDKLVSTGLLLPGVVLEAYDDWTIQCEVLEDGSFQLNRVIGEIGGKPLGFVTIIAADILHWGFIRSVNSPRSPNSGVGAFWTYFDEFTQRKERLNRLYALASSSWEQPPLQCAMCKEVGLVMTMGDSEKTDLVTTANEGGQIIIIPKRHFTNFEGMPKRDLGALSRSVGKVTSKAIRQGKQVTVSKMKDTHGHVYIEVVTN